MNNETKNRLEKMLNTAIWKNYYAQQITSNSIESLERNCTANKKNGRPTKKMEGLLAKLNRQQTRANVLQIDLEELKNI